MSSLPLTDPRDPAPAPGQQRPPHLKALTAVRFFAALYVALYQLVRPFALWGPFQNVLAVGYTGVSFFFLLSGFILTYTHADEGRPTRQSVLNFYFARFARTYPVYFLVTIASGLVLYKFFAQPVHVLAFLADFLMVQTWSVRMVIFSKCPPGRFRWRRFSTWSFHSSSGA